MSISKEVVIEFLVETILFVPSFSFTLWHIKYRKHNRINEKE